MLVSSPLPLIRLLCSLARSSSNMGRLAAEGDGQARRLSLVLPPLCTPLLGPMLTPRTPRYSYACFLPFSAPTSLFAHFQPKKKSKTSSASDALLSLSLSGAVLVFFASPAQRSLDTTLVVYFSLCYVSVLGGIAVGNFVTDEEGNAASGWVHLLGLPVAFAIVYFALLMRRKIGAKGLQVKSVSKKSIRKE